MAGLMHAAALVLALAVAGWRGPDTQGRHADVRRSDAVCPGGGPDENLLGFAYEAFEEAGPPFGWRALLSAGCEDAAATLLQAYLARNRDRLSSEQQSEVRFHVGQVYALAGRDGDALPHFEAAAWPGATAEWAAYVDATVAFLRKDRARLEAAIAHYAGASGGVMRLRVVRGLLACLDQQYAQAVHCSP